MKEWWNNGIVGNSPTFHYSTLLGKGVISDALIQVELNNRDL